MNHNIKMNSSNELYFVIRKESDPFLDETSNKWSRQVRALHRGKITHEVVPFRSKELAEKMKVGYAFLKEAKEDSGDGV